jgi:hypothetical protein
VSPRGKSGQVLDPSHHAVDVGGQMVEPGQPIPAKADPEVVEQLREAGLIVDAPEQAERSTEEEGS